MNTKQFITKAIQKATVCLMATVLSMSLTGCAEKNSENNEDPLPPGVPAQLVNTWVGMYSSYGEITEEGAGSRKGDYAAVVEALKFNADGTGTCYKYLCDVAGEPLSVYGGAMDEKNGRFHFTVKNDSIVTIVRDGDGDSQNPKTWTVVNGSTGIRATHGAKEYLMQTANTDQLSYLTNWEKQLRTGTNDDETNNFLEDWESVKTITLIKHGSRYTPWAGSADNDIPENIRKDVLRADGWEMAFCMLNDEFAPQVHMFALYNKYTGIMRVFQYVEDASAYGNELFFTLVTESSTEFKYRYPFYHTMAYAIPIGKKWGEELNPRAELINDGYAYLPFQYASSAYTLLAEARGVTVGWHCFDLDLSAYMPESIGRAWHETQDMEADLFHIRLSTQRKSDVTLNGRLFGTLAGEFNGTSTAKSSCNNPTLKWWTNTISNVSGAFNSSLTNINCICGISKNGTGVFSVKGERQAGNEHNNDNQQQGENQGGNEQPNPARVKKSITAGTFALVGIGLNIASAVMKSIDNPTKNWNDLKGNISMDLNANLDIQGEIKEWTGVPDAGINVTPSLLKASNKNSFIGTGCFGLAEDPVVYVCEEDLLSSTERINITSKDGTMLCPTIVGDSLRLLVFLDPASIKPMLNTKLYRDIKDVELTVNYAVDANKIVGNTDSYRRFMNLGDRPVVKLRTKMSTDEKSKPRLHVLNPYDYVQYDEFALLNRDSIKLVEQKGNNGFKYYGASNAFWSKNCMVEPQVFVPYVKTAATTVVDHAEVPDIFVSVNLRFTCRECPQGVEFNKAYLPKFVLLKHSELKEKYEQLQAYANKCSNEEAVGHLENKPEIPIYNYSSDVFLDKTLYTLKKILDIK